MAGPPPEAGSSVPCREPSSAGPGRAGRLAGWQRDRLAHSREGTGGDAPRPWPAQGVHTVPKGLWQITAHGGFSTPTGFCPQRAEASISARSHKAGGGGVPSRGWGGGLSFLLSSGGHILGSWLHHPPPPPPSVLLTQRVRTSPRTLVITLPPSPAKDSKPFTTAAKSLLPWKGTYPQGPAIGRTTSLGHRIVSLRQGQMPHVPLWPSLRPSQPR